MKKKSTISSKPNLYSATSFLSWSQIIFWLLIGSLIVYNNHVSPFAVTVISMIGLALYCRLKHYTAYAITAKASSTLLAKLPSPTTAEIKEVLRLCVEYTNIALVSPMAYSHGHVLYLNIFWSQVLSRIDEKKIKSLPEVIAVLKNKNNNL